MCHFLLKKTLDNTMKIKYTIEVATKEIKSQKGKRWTITKSKR